jgi:hypothetical protein
MKKHIGNILRWAFTIAIFVYLFKYKIDARDLWDKVQAAHWGWILLAVLLFGVTFWCGVLRWRLLLQTQEIVLPFRRVTAICFVGHFFNSFFLGSTGGDVVKAVYAAKQTETHKHEAVMSVLVDRIIGLIGLFVIALIMMALNYRWLVDHRNLHVPSLAVLILIASVFIALPVTMWRKLPNLFPWLAKLKSKLKVHAHISRALDSYQSYARHKRTVIQALLLSVGVHVTIIIGIVFIARGLGITQVRWDKYFLIIPVINTIASIPITVSGFGLREGMYTLMFGDLGVGVTDEQAVAVGLLSYGVQFFWSLFGGLVFTFWKHEAHMLQQAQEDLDKIEGAASQ